MQMAEGAQKFLKHNLPPASSLRNYSARLTNHFLAAGLAAFLAGALLGAAFLAGLLAAAAFLAGALLGAAFLATARAINEKGKG
jgi:hypothetical protein